MNLFCNIIKVERRCCM